MEDILKFAVIEDDKPCQDNLINQVTSIVNELNKLATFDTFSNGLEFIEHFKDYDIIFLDIDMPLMNGLETAKKIREKDENVIIIFVTNFAQYALKGYDVNAKYFLIKPIKYDNLKIKLSILINKIDSSKKEKYIMLKTTSGYERVLINEIIYIESNLHYALFYLKNKFYKVRMSMKDAEKTMKPYHFAQCNSSYLVNLEYVNKIIDNTVFIENFTLPLSRLKKEIFLNALAEFYGE